MTRMVYPSPQSLVVRASVLASILVLLSLPTFAQSSRGTPSQTIGTVVVSPSIGTVFEIPLPQVKEGESLAIGLLNNGADVIDSNRTYRLIEQSNPVVIGTQQIDGTEQVLLQGHFPSAEKTYFFGIRPDGVISKASFRLSQDRKATHKSGLLVRTSLAFSPELYTLLLRKDAANERLFSPKFQAAANLMKPPGPIPFSLLVHKSGERLRFKVTQELSNQDSLSIILMISSRRAKLKTFSTFRPQLEVGRIDVKLGQERSVNPTASVILTNDNQPNKTLEAPRSSSQSEPATISKNSSSNDLPAPQNQPLAPSGFLAAANVPVQGTGKQYYVDFLAGVDTNTGLTMSAPWKHAPGDVKATDVAKTAVLKAGDAVLFKGGVVYEGAVVPKFSGTADGGKVLYKGDSWGTGKAIMEGGKLLFTAFDVSADFIRIEGFEIRNYKQGVDIESYNYTTKIAKGNNVDIVNNTIHDISAKGVQTRYVKNILLEGNEIFNTGYDSFTLQASDVIVRNNHLHHGNVDGIKGGGGGTILIENNHIHDFTSGTNHGDGIQMMWYKKLIVRNNLFYNSTQNVFIAPYCPAGKCDYRVGDAYVYNNIVANPNPGASGIGGMYNGINVHPGGLGAGHVHIYNNTLINLNAGSAGVRIAARWTPPNLTKAFLSVSIKNNIFYNSLMTPSSSLSESTTVSNNIFFNTVRPTSWYKGHLTNDPASKYANPLLKDIATFDV